MDAQADRQSRTGLGRRLSPRTGVDDAAAAGVGQAELSALVAHLRQQRVGLCEEWARRIMAAPFLTTLTHDELTAECGAVYDNYLGTLETGSTEALEAYATDLSARIIPRGVETQEVVGIVLLLRDVLSRSLFAQYGDDRATLDRILDAYEPAANRIANTVAVGFVQERERIIREQQEDIRELSKLVLPVRKQLLILTIIGVIDPPAARQLTEELRLGIRRNRARELEANAALRRMNEMLEAEAKRVAHALHDQAGTVLAAAYLELAEVARELPPPAVERLQRITAHLDQVRVQLRRLSHEVHPPILDQLGLVPAVQFLAEGIGKRTGLIVTVSGKAPRDFSQTVNTTIYRVIQEALANVTRHAQATRASIRMWQQSGRLHCLIRDNGIGFDVAVGRGRQARCGLGLVGMEERIAALGGNFDIASAPGQGTTIRVSLPRQRD